MKSIFDINGFISKSLGFSDGLWLLIAAIVFALLCLCFVLAVRDGRVKGRSMFLETGWTALWYFGLLALSLFTCWPFGDKQALWTPSRPALVWCVAAVAVAGADTWYVDDAVGDALLWWPTRLQEKRAQEDQVQRNITSLARPPSRARRRGRAREAGDWGWAKIFFASFPIPHSPFPDRIGDPTIANKILNVCR